MTYMLLIYGAEDAWTADERAACMIESMGICDDLAAQGKYRMASPLEPVATARTVRVRGGEPLITAGPFAETAEQLGGFYVLDLAHLDEAIAVASRLPPAAKGTVEIRPIARVEGLPPSRPIPAGTGAPESPYLLLCHDDEASWHAAGQEARSDALAEAVALTRELADSGRFLSAAPLHGPETATCVRVRDGRRSIIDGPFAETHEVLGGYYAILAPSRDEAVRIASRHPGARLGSVEVRPLFDPSGLRNLPRKSAGPVDPRPARSTT